MATRAELVSMTTVLDARSIVVLRLRFLHNMTQAEIAERMGLSQQMAGKILSAAVEELRRHPNIILDLEPQEN